MLIKNEQTHQKAQAACAISLRHCPGYAAIESPPYLYKVCGFALISDNFNQYLLFFLKQNI